MRILIAEDSQTQAVDLRRRLEAMGHEVVVTSSGLEAWNHLRARPERLVITDWMMPEMNGLELCRKIRGETGSPYVYTDPPDRQEPPPRAAPGAERRGRRLPGQADRFRRARDRPRDRPADHRGTGGSGRGPASWSPPTRNWRGWPRSTRPTGLKNRRGLRDAATLRRDQKGSAGPPSALPLAGRIPVRRTSVAPWGPAETEGRLTGWQTELASETSGGVPRLRYGGPGGRTGLRPDPSRIIGRGDPRDRGPAPCCAVGNGLHRDTRR